MRLEKKGKIFFQNGDIYDGNLKDQKFHGKGVYFNGKENNWIAGIFDENQINYPPSQYNDVFIDDIPEKVDFYQQRVNNNVISNSLLLKCIFVKNIFLCQNASHINLFKLHVPSSINTNNKESINSQISSQLFTQGHFGGNGDSKEQYNSQQYYSQLENQQLENSKLGYKDQLLHLQDDNNGNELLIENNISLNRVTSDDICDNNFSQQKQKNQTYLSHQSKNSKTKYDIYDEIIESKQNNSFQMKNQENQSVKRQYLQNNIIKNYSIDKQKQNNKLLQQKQNIKNQTHLIDKSLFEKQIFKNQQNYQSQKHKVQLLSTLDNKINNTLQQEKSSQLQQRQQQNKVSQNSQKHKVQSHLLTQNKDKINQELQNNQNKKKLQTKQDQLDEKQNKTLKVNQMNQIEKNLKTEPSVSIERQQNNKIQNIKCLKTEPDTSKEICVKTELNNSMQNNQSKISKMQGSCADNENNLKYHIKKHCETIKNMLIQDQHPQKNNNYYYKSNPKVSQNKHLINNKTLQESMINNKINQFSRSNSANTINQTPNQSRNKFQQQDTSLQKIQFQSADKYSKFLTEKSPQKRPTSYFMVRQATINKQQNEFIHIKISQQNSGYIERILLNSQSKKDINNLSQTKTTPKELSQEHSTHPIKKNYKIQQ